MGIVKRGKWYHLRRRVPQRYARVESRTVVWQALHTTDPKIATFVEDIIWHDMLNGWEARLRGDTSDSEARFAAAQELAEIRGKSYESIRAVAQMPVADILDRVQSIPAPDGKPDKTEAAAILGTVEAPKITVSRALEMYWGLTKDRLQGKNEDQIRKWVNPRKKAVSNFVKIVGDKAIENITRDDMLTFRDWWLDRIDSGDVTANAGNKDFIHLGDVLKTVNKLRKLGLDLPLGDLSFKEGEARTRPPFSNDWIKSKLLAEGTLDGLNSDARGILLGMVNTGYRPSEGAALTADTIRLDADVPHISIEPQGRQLKSQYARRVIPLTGVSLEAFRASPNGFERYRTNSSSLSATVNKFLRENRLLETPRHSMYSLRHAFEDRMLAAGIDDRIRRDVFGHRLTRERYGHGASLSQVHDLLERLAF